MLFTVLGIIALLAGSTLTVLSSYGLFMFRGQPRSQLSALYGLILATYPLGQAFRNLEWGLDVMRYNLADVGFPVFVAFVLSRECTLELYRLAKNMDSETWLLRTRFYKEMRIFAGIGIAVSLVWECLAWFANERADDPIIVGTFDPNDVAAYFIGGSAAILIRTAQLRISRHGLADALQFERELKRHTRTERRSVKTRKKKRRR